MTQTVSVQISVCPVHLYICVNLQNHYIDQYFFFFSAPGRGVKVPGIILVHDPRWGPERKQGVFLPPPSPRPRTGCCALALCWPRLGLVPLGGGTPGTGPPERRALHHFFPALRAPRDPGVTYFLSYFFFPSNYTYHILYISKCQGVLLLLLMDSTQRTFYFFNLFILIGG